MKSILKITLLTLFSCTLLLNAQDTKKWYADDIYFDQSEKEVSYVSIIQDDDVYMIEDSLEDYMDDRMSYSMRINRFHRDYYGSSISFNYGYFHAPFDFNYGFGYMNNYYPFYNNYWGIGWPYYDWNYPYFGFGNYFNPWYSPWNFGFYSWNNPYNYAFGYGFTPNYYGNGVYTSSETIYYGPRNGASTNTPSSIVGRPSKNYNKPQDLQSTITQNPLIRSIVKGSRQSISRQPSSNKSKQKTSYAKPKRSSYDSPKGNSSQKPLRRNSNSYNKPSNTRSNTNYSPARRSGSSPSYSSPGRRPR